MIGCFFERIVIPSNMFMIPSITCCKPPSPSFISFCITKRCTLSIMENISLTWTGSYLLLVNVQFLSLPNHSITVCVKEKIIKGGVGFRLKIPAEFKFIVNEKVIQGAKRKLDGVDGNVKKKVLRSLK